MPLPRSILRLLEQLDTDQCSMPPTILYNEGWMLRFVLDAGKQGHLPSMMSKGVSWYSEAQLRTPFGKDKDPKHEANTHADGVVGDFTDITDTKSGLELVEDASQFSIVEAKMYSPLSSRTKNAPGYDQAARNVACIAYTLQQARRKPNEIENVGFYVVAPESQIDSGLFAGPMSPQSIRSRVAERIQQFTGVARDELMLWHDHWFLPLLGKMKEDQTLKCVSWEELIQEISDSDAAIGNEISQFYSKCKQYNLAVTRSADRSGRPERGKEYVLLSGKHKGQRVRVGSAAPSNSRVYRENSHEDSFLVPNGNLELVPESKQTPPPLDPIANRECVWANAPEGSLLVRVVNVGDCNSRVIRADSEGSSFKVPNHQLRETEVT